MENPKKSSALSSLYAEAAKEQTATLSGLNHYHHAKEQQKLAKSGADPTSHVREHATEKIARFLHVVSVDLGNASVLDVGCTIGNDLSRIAHYFDGLVGANAPTKCNLVLHGVDLLDAQLEVAREKLPFGHFHAGDATSLPQLDGSITAVYCSRLLIHIPQIYIAIDEMVRVMCPGGMGVVCEGDYGSHTILTPDAALKSIHDRNTTWMCDMLAQPHAAAVAYACLKSHPQIAEAELEVFGINSDMTKMDAGLAMTRQFLSKQVDQQIITTEEMNVYIAAMEQAPMTGTPVWINHIFVITFIKKVE